MKKLIKNLNLVESTRKTSHLGSTCALVIESPEFGKDYSVINQMAYQMAGYDEDQLFMATVYYEDDMQFGPVLVGFKRDDNQITIEHISKTRERNYKMTFNKVASMASMYEAIRSWREYNFAQYHTNDTLMVVMYNGIILEGYVTASTGAAVIRIWDADKVLNTCYYVCSNLTQAHQVVRMFMMAKDMAADMRFEHMYLEEDHFKYNYYDNLEENGSHVISMVNTETDTLIVLSVKDNCLYIDLDQNKIDPIGPVDEHSTVGEIIEEAIVPFMKEQKYGNK